LGGTAWSARTSDHVRSLVLRLLVRRGGRVARLLTAIIEVFSSLERQFGNPEGRPEDQQALPAALLRRP